MPTPHIAAEPGQIADRVIMPGDPRRAERIASAVLDAPELVTDVRGILGYTGLHRGRPLTVMASGMGGPSLSIYATELARVYGVRTIVRVGTAGAMSASIAVGDVVVATAAHTDSAMSASRIPGIFFSHAPDFSLAATAMTAVVPAAGAVHAGAVFSSDHFYLDRPATTAALVAHGTLAVEMEAAALYAVGAAERVRTLAVVTVSDHLVTGEEMSSRARETAFENALTVALAAVA